MDHHLIESIEKAQEAVAKADALLITAGAGMGVDSGLPDFRGNEGFWKAYPAIAHLGYSFVEMANPAWFDRDPQLAWAFYGHRLNLYRATTPHQGFSWLLELAQHKQAHFVFTSNVDGQFQKAGFLEEQILECHGSIHHFQCTQCDAPIYDAPPHPIKIDMKCFYAKETPRCPRCGAVARPNILMFQDWGWKSERTHQQTLRYEAFLKEVHRKKLRLVILEIGAGTHIPTVRHESEQRALDLDGFAVRINPREPEIPPHLGVGIAQGGLAGLKAILKPTL